MKKIIEIRKTLLLFIVIFFAYFSFSCSDGQSKQGIDNLVPYPDELQAGIGRGLVALSKDQNRIFLSWRLLPTDPQKISFNVYRSEGRVEEKRPEVIAQTDKTFYIDDNVQANQTYFYTIVPVSAGKQGESSREATVTTTKNGQNALVFDLGQDYKYAQVAAGDLDGDGELEIVVKHANTTNVDPNKRAWHKSDDTIKLTAFHYTGERLWTMDLGWGIEAGNNYSPVVIWDIDADGRAEVLLKTNKSGGRLDYEGERLSVIEGQTGEIINEAKWPLIKGHFADDYNNNSRNRIAIAHLDGRNPNIIVARGLYKTQVIWAYDAKLNRVWERIIGKDIYNPIKNKWLVRMRLRKIWRRLFKDRSRGAHYLPIADINNDGKEEILWGEHCIGEGGKDLWVIEDQMPYNGHADVVFVADILPSNEGKEIFYGREGWYGKENDGIGMMLADKNGKTIWTHWGYTHVDGGWVGKLLPDREGLQCFGFDVQEKIWNKNGPKYTQKTNFLWDAEGNLIATPSESWVWSTPVDWDGDDIKEIITASGEVQKYNGTVLARLGQGCLWGADLFGDHREEIVIAPGNYSYQSRKIYIVFNTDTMENLPKITRIADRQYRNDLSRTAAQYNNAMTEGGFIPQRNF